MTWMTHKAGPWATSAMCEHCASTDGARRAQNCALYTSVCFVVSVPLFAMCSSMFMLCVKMYAVCRSHLCIVNVREYEVQGTFPLQEWRTTRQRLRPTTAKPTLVILIWPTLANPTLAKPTLANKIWLTLAQIWVADLSQTDLGQF